MTSLMKKLWIAALLGLMLALSGCGGEKTEDAEEAAAVEEGQYKIEIFTAGSSFRRSWIFRRW